jgi:5-formyltetrahydrofolate cyclo-ligase
MISVFVQFDVARVCSVNLDKLSLRNDMHARREGLSFGERAHAAGAVAAHTEALLSIAPGEGAPIVSTYWAIGPEIDPVSLEAALVSHGAALCLPVMAGRDKPLVFRRYQHGDALQLRTWGIQEPLPEAGEGTPSILLVPLLAADLSGARLGYGGGFYDRTLRQLRAGGEIAAVGLCYDEQLVGAVPHSDHDEYLDWLLTPSGLVQAGAQLSR